MRFGVLGPLAAWAADGRPVRVPEAKVRALLASLLVDPGRVVSVDRLADRLWGERLPRNPANTIQTKISQLRRVLDAAEPGARDLVGHQPPGYVLHVDDESLDARRFESLTERARAAADPRERVALLTDALALWRGPVLADFADAPFAAPLARRLEEQRLVAEEDRAQARLDLGEHDVLAGELAELVAAHPLRERLRAVQMRALYRAGRQSEALDAYLDLRERLDRELGLEPGPEISALHGSILRQDAALEVRPARRTNLPAPLTELVGRDDAVAAVRSLVSGARLVTLTGPGGVGKTGLAVEVARSLEAADGVWLVEFAGLERQVGAGPDSLDEWGVAVVTAALDIRDEAAGASADRLTDVLRGKDVVLLLDNCEQVVEPVAALVARLLRAAPGLRVLATGQVPLGLTGEVVWTVPPLEVPGADVVAAAEVGRFSAVRLFLARAAAARPGVALDSGNAAAVAAICRRLDGIPLALELAATRVRALGVGDLLSRLDDRFGLLTTGPRDAPARQRTLRAVIDWSWEPLGEAERTVLRRLAVHADGCTLAAAEAVCSGDGVRPEDVLDVLARLVDRSLVVSQPGRTGQRYRLLESVAAYCLDRLREAGELEAVRLRHARHHLVAAERAEPLLRGPHQRARLDELDAEAANLRSALDTFVEHGEAGAALRLARALTWFWFLRGRFCEACRALRGALSVPGASRSRRGEVAVWAAGLAVLGGDPVDEEAFGQAAGIADPGARSRALWFAGYVRSTIGDMAAGRRFTDAALRDFEALGDKWGIAAALADRTSQALGAGDLAAADRAARRSAELFDELGDRWGQLQASFARGVLAETFGDHERARRLHSEGLHKARELELWPEVSYQLTWLGRNALLTGDHALAREHHERAAEIARDRGFRAGELYAVTGLALGARREGDLDLAEHHLDEVLRWYRDSAFEPSSTLVHAEFGFVAELRGDAERAAEHHHRGFELALQLGDSRAVALAMEGLAGAEALAGRHARAARLLGAAARARESVGTPLIPAESADVDRITAAARAELGDELFAAEFERGAQSSPEEFRRR
ncbi:putative ATPase [Saccharopolyspora erythraea NRRL 2338]|uniref:Multi-domain regulatory protein n=2 Tax=Saccharopolyspora erythraea TaxID=1836 RepID=A4FKK2_SACEN|nr:BTAD domain-containing putative transcriptional regulator [Saccharopolyspora erythraea]EQD82914.1 ATPase [Saccharopolyspora erythraea D]PFG98215.1 putative ATPase [Saccharopolyspora erythraea NRRL 2338]QRK88313.1 winged helix-turn-helix domain-containing protein [Saccharopolyspora erythraea]CAM04577.1 multi-domain regulatory protein [Saccharopolyspora erythraea NRRL 2338]